LPYIRVAPSNGPTSGQTYSMYIYVPSGSTTTINAKLYVMDSTHTWHTSSDLGVTIPATSTWVQLSFLLPSYSGAAIQVGLQLYATPNNTTATCYVDAVNWG
jgi:hypothetical protein